jgi:phosphoribulokinase
VIRKRPIILGIVGDSAAGKTTLTSGLVKLIGPDRVTHVCTDDYHKYDRRERSIHKITALHPDCNYVDIMELHLERLHYGQPILKPVYDHSNGTLTRPEYVIPREFVIVEGLLGYHTATMRNFYDVKVYLAPDERLRRLWKVKRDTTKRGYTEEQVLADMDKREPDSDAFIRPQRAHADIVINFYPPEEVDPKEAGSNLNVRLTLRPTIPHPDLSYLWNIPDHEESGIRAFLDRDSGKPVDVLEIDGNVSPDAAAGLEQTIWDHMPDVRQLGADQFGDYYDQAEVRHSDPLALTQLLLTYQLLRQYNDVVELPFAKPTAAITRMISTSTAA